MKLDPKEYYKKQISLTEWFEAMGHPDSAKHRQEDNDKRERLAVLNQIIGLPYDKPAQFSADEVARRSPAFKRYLREHGNELCAVRIIPDNPDLPKLRMRGHSVVEGTKWFDEQKLDPKHYRVDFVPHTESVWATIFVVGPEGITGELTRGEHNELTQGLYTTHKPIVFNFDWQNWHFSEDVDGAKEHLQEVINHLLIEDIQKQEQIKQELNGGFANNYLVGYFETTTSNDRGIWFIDYNRLLGGLPMNTQNDQKVEQMLLRGRPGSVGQVTGKVRIVLPHELTTADISDDEILVCEMTTPDYLPLMLKSGAIVTELGGALSHAAIVARELKKPCITSAKGATTVLLPGQMVTVDATKGVVTAA